MLIVRTIQNHIKPVDAILWRVNMLMEEATTPVQIGHAQKAILEILALIPDQLIRENYFDTIVKQRKWKKKDLEKVLNDLVDKKTSAPSLPKVYGNSEEIEIEDETKLPKWITSDNLKEFWQKGYFAVKRRTNDTVKVGFYTLSISRGDNGTNYTPVQITNFTADPLFHIYAGAKSRHMIKLYNGFISPVLDVESKCLPSPDQFQSISVTEGNFIIFGSKQQWLRIASDLLQNFPRCIELEELGFQDAGFFAYSDAIYLPGTGILPVDNYGIFKHKEQQYLLPQQCEAYQQLSGSSADPYENDRFLTYKQSPISFTDWCCKMERVFGIKSAIGISWLVFCLFRDIVMKTTSTSPHLYLYGPSASGKSAMANMLSSLFYVGRKPFIAYEGTIFAFYAYLSRFKNAPAFINEFDVNAMDMDRIQAIKGVFDGEGRERGKKDGGKRATEIQKINSGLLLVGQYLVTIDDNSIINRSIIESFLPDENRTEDDIQQFNELDEISKRGITSLLTELLNLRTYFETNFRSKYLELLKKWINRSAEESKPLVQRIMQNYCMMATCYNMLAEHYANMPIKATDNERYCLEKAREWSVFVSSSDSLSEFWRFVAFLFDKGEIIDKWDLEISLVHSIEIRESKQKLSFDAGANILFVRINNVHNLYAKHFRSQTGKEAMSMQNLLHYFKSKKYYLGSVKQRMFKKPKQTYKENVENQVYHETVFEQTYTSCYAFLYDDIAKQVPDFNLLRANGLEKFQSTEESNKAAATSANGKDIDWAQPQIF